MYIKLNWKNITFYILNLLLLGYIATKNTTNFDKIRWSKNLKSIPLLYKEDFKTIIEWI